MPRSKTSKGRVRGGRVPKLDDSFIPFLGTSTTSGHQDSLQSEAFNTQRHQSSLGSDQKLRHSKVNFVSAGDFEPPELLAPVASLAELSLKDQSKDIRSGFISTRQPHTEQKSVTRTKDVPPLVKEDGMEPLFVVDIRGSQSIATGFPAPRIRSSSSTSSDSSGEVIVYAGRDPAGRGVSRIPPSRSRQILNTSQTQIRIIEDGTVTQDVLPAAVDSPNHGHPLGDPERSEDESIPAASNLGNYLHSTSQSGKVNIFRSKNSLGTGDRTRDQRLIQKIEEQALLDDYIANMEANDSAEGLSYNQRELGGHDTELWQETDATESSLPLSPKETPKGGWSPSEICDFDDLSTSDELFGSIDAILSKRNRAAGTQYLVVRKDQTVDDARWIPASSLKDSAAVKLMEKFEAQEKLVEEFMNGEEDSESESEDKSYDQGGSYDHDAELDDFDLVERKLLRMTDEKIAKVLAKQEELGMGSSKLVLFGDSSEEENEEYEYDMVFNDVSKPVKSRQRSIQRAKIPRGYFPAADSLADAYDGFDVMDFERPSLKKKSNGRKGKLVFDLSDSELESSMQVAWDKDRVKKKARKEERATLRAQGLLGKNSRKPDLKAKYKEGMGIHAVKSEIKEFLKSENTTLALPPMDKADRKVVHELANAFNLKSKSAGNGTKRFPILYRTSRTSPYNERTFVTVEARLTRRYLPRMDVQGKNSVVMAKRAGRGGFSSTAVTYRDGDVVGGSAPELGTENKGRAMLEKMGWSSGTALGALNNKGILQPVSHVVKTTKAGLG